MQSSAKSWKFVQSRAKSWKFVQSRAKSWKVVQSHWNQGKPGKFLHWKGFTAQGCFAGFTTYPLHIGRVQRADPERATPWKHPENTLKYPENTLKTEFPENTLKKHPELGEGKWGRKKYRRIPKCEGDQQGRVPKRSLHPKNSSKQEIRSSQFFRDLSQVVRRTPRDTPVPLYTRTSPWPTEIHGFRYVFPMPFVALQAQIKRASLGPFIGCTQKTLNGVQSTGLLHWQKL